MSSPSEPSSLEHLSTRPFSFYPAILHVEHNEFLFRKATWSEILVVNCKSGEEIWIPRRFLGEVSKIEDPVVIVGLNKELEYAGGAVWPYQRRVIEMPLAVGGGAASTDAGPGPQGTPPHPAPDAPIASRSGAETRIFRLIGIALAVAILLYLGAVSLLRIGEVQQRMVLTAKDQSYLELTSRDGYAGVVAKLGTPASDHWQSESGEIQYRALAYPQRKFTVILMGDRRDDAQYVGTMDENWKPLHSVELHSGGTTASLLRGLQRF
jgi:hypothetical protein